MELHYVFVHGFAGWGSYDERYKKMPYWGMRGGDLITRLRKEGYHAYAASVSPKGSTWDRACELYAQIFGTKVDYGEAHSNKFHHERYGKDYSDCPLLPEWNDEMKLVLIGHSFGGVTARLFTELMANGSQIEREHTKAEECSPLFSGGMGDRIHSVVAIASSLNGNSVYTMLDDPAFDPTAVKVSWKARFFARIFAKVTRKQSEGLDPVDCAEYDMHIDSALEMNRNITDLPHVYYYSVPCCYTVKQEDGTYMPEKDMESVFALRSAQMGRYCGRTKEGYEIDSEWWMNDGRVNTISEIAPFGSKKINLESDTVPEPGIWNVYPIYHGDHMSLQGGYRRGKDISRFYIEMLKMISKQ